MSMQRGKSSASSICVVRRLATAEDAQRYGGVGLEYVTPVDAFLKGVADGQRSSNVRGAVGSLAICLLDESEVAMMLQKSGFTGQRSAPMRAKIESSLKIHLTRRNTDFSFQKSRGQLTTRSQNANQLDGRLDAFDPTADDWSSLERGRPISRKDMDPSALFEADLHEFGNQIVPIEGLALADGNAAMKFKDIIQLHTERREIIGRLAALGLFVGALAKSDITTVSLFTTANKRTTVDMTQIPMPVPTEMWFLPPTLEVTSRSS